MTTLTLNSRTFALPDSRDELTPAQARRVARLLTLPPVLARERALYAIASPRRGWGRGWRKFMAAEPVESLRPLEVLALADPILYPPPPATRKDRVQALVPDIWHRGRRYLWPEPGLGDVLLGEWAFAAEMMQRVRSQGAQGEADLRMLTAGLLRPRRSARERRARDWDGISRVAWNPQHIEARLRAQRGLPDWAHLVTLDYVGRAGKWLEVSFPRLFRGEVSSGPNWGWPGTIMNLAGDRPQDIAETETLPLLTVCTYLYKRLADQQAKQQATKAGR